MEVGVNLSDNKGDTPLHYAIQNRNLEMIYLLVILGDASLKLKNRDGISSKKLAKQMQLDLSLVLTDHNKCVTRQHSLPTVHTLTNLFTRKRNSSLPAFSEIQESSVASTHNIQPETTMSTNVSRQTSHHSHNRFARRFSFNFSDLDKQQFECSNIDHREDGEGT